MGFEPTLIVLKTIELTIFSIPNKLLCASFLSTWRKGGLEQVTGLEPVPSAWQAEILTDYTIPA